MDHEWSKAEFNRQMSQVRAVYSSAQPKDAIVRLTATCLLHVIHYSRQLRLRSLRREQLLLACLSIFVPVIGNSLIVERDLRIGGIHHGARAHLIRPLA